jgi:hypothetical protein
MAVYLAPPPSANPQPASSDRFVASGLGFTCGVSLVMRGVWVIVPSSAPPMGGPGVPGGTSTLMVDLPGCRPDPANEVLALGSFHPNSGVPPSLGCVGVHPVVSSLDMGGLGVHFAQGPSQSGVGGTGVPGGASVLNGGNIGCQPDPDKAVPSSACSYHALGFPHPSASPCSLRSSPVPTSVAGSAFHPSRHGAFLHSSVSFSGHSGDHLVARSSVGGYQGGCSSSSSSGSRGGTRGRLSPLVYSIPSALCHWGSDSSVGDESNWTESTSDDISLSLILLPVDKFTLSPIK